MYSPWNIFNKLQTMSDKEEIINFIKSIPRKESEYSFYVIKSSKGYWNPKNKSWENKICRAHWYNDEFQAKKICQKLQTQYSTKTWIQEVDDTEN